MSKALTALTQSLVPDLDDEFLLNVDGNPRRTPVKNILDLNSMIHVQGVNSNGTDTAAFEAAVAEANAASPKKSVYITGILNFTPSSTQLRIGVPVYVNGDLRPSTTIVMNDGATLIGSGGSGQRSAWNFGSELARITAPAGAIPAVEVIGTNVTLSGFYISNAHTCVYLNGVTQTSGLVTIEKCYFRATGTGGSGLLIENYFWGWIRNCIISGVAPAVASVSILSPNNVFAGTGLFYFTDILIADLGVHILGDDGAVSNVYFKNMHFEGMHEEGFNLEKCNNITFDQVGFSDSPLGQGSLTIGPGVSGLRFENTIYPTNFTDTSGVPDSHITLQSIVEGDFHPGKVISPGADKTKKFVSISGDTDTRIVSRTHAGAPVGALGTTGGSLLPSAGGGATITPAQFAPDGTSTAYKMAVSAGDVRLDIDKAIVATTGDIVAFGGWFRTNVRDRALNYSTGYPMQITLYPAVSGLTFVPGDTDSSTSSVSLFGFVTRWANVGWVPAYGFAELAGTGTTSSLRFTFSGRVGYDFFFWGCWYRLFPAALGYDRAMVVKYMDSIGSVPGSLKAGVTGLQDHQTFRTGINTTANRPSASAVGAGAQFFDSTLGKPIWSNGTVWKDAVGTTV